jgi:hypothetical protein
MIAGPTGRDYLVAMIVLLVVGGCIGIGVEHLAIYLFHHISIH